MQVLTRGRGELMPCVCAPAGCGEKHQQIKKRAGGAAGQCAPFSAWHVMLAWTVRSGNLGR